MKGLKEDKLGAFSFEGEESALGGAVREKGREKLGHINPAPH